MQEVFEKIIEQLKENIFLDSYEPVHLGNNKAIMDAIKIVQQVAAEYNNGWIPVEERLPEDDGEYEVTYEHTYRGDVRYKTKRAWFQIGCWSTQFNVIAWKPLPEPYKPKGEKI